MACMQILSSLQRWNKIGSYPFLDILIKQQQDVPEEGRDVDITIWLMVTILKRIYISRKWIYSTGDRTSI